MDSVLLLLFAFVINLVLCKDFFNDYSHYNVHHTNMFPPRGYRPVYAMAYTTYNINDTKGNIHKRIDKITIVDENESVLFDVFKPLGKEFNTVREELANFISCRLLVGHELHECLNILGIQHPEYLIRDTTYFCNNCSNVTHVHDSLEKIAKEFLSVDIDYLNTTTNAITALRVYKKFEREWEIYNLQKHQTAFAIDCEMIECLNYTKQKHRVEAVARVSVVDQIGNVVYDNLIKPELPVSDYRTFITGLDRRNLSRAANFTEVRERLKNLLKGHVLVGHAVWHDLSLLKIKHPLLLCRDSSKFITFRRMFPGKHHPSLKDLARKVLNKTIHQYRRHHDSIEDAHTAMLLYLQYRQDWDEDVMKQM